MTELCCSHSIDERISRAQLLLCLRLRVSPILHSTNCARSPGNQALARLTPDRAPYLSMGGLLGIASLAENKAIQESTTSIAAPGSSALPGRTAFLLKGGRL